MSVTPLVATSGALQSQMDSVFDSMINVTRPGVFEGQRRGVVSAGSVYVRNKIVDTNVVTFVPPSWKGGCGGIDFFGGSFSFIDADQFIQLMRAVASNLKTVESTLSQIRRRRARGTSGLWPSSP